MSNALTPIAVDQLPPASTFLNYPRQGPDIGKYLGPNLDGEYFTVVSRDPGQGPSGTTRVGLAYGCYMINGESTDPDGFPAPVAAAKLQSEWQALRSI